MVNIPKNPLLCQVSIQWSAKKTLQELANCEYCLALYSLTRNHAAPAVLSELLEAAASSYDQAATSKKHIKSYARRHGGQPAVDSLLTRLSICDQVLNLVKGASNV